MKAILYIHGMGGSADEAEHYKALCRDFNVIGLDYEVTNPWETKPVFQAVFDELSGKYESVSIIANSIGAYFAMNALSDRKIGKAFFISPVVSMEKLIGNMMLSASVTEGELSEKKVIETPNGTLSWEYLSYVRVHPISWRVPTHVLYAGGDMLTDRETVTDFCRNTGAALTVMENGEHWFHTEEQMAFLDEWLIKAL